MRYEVGRFRRPMRRSTEGQLAGLVDLGDGSTLSLDFTAMSGLDSRFTFSRASTATFINSSGLVQYADANLILQSESLATSPWAATNGASVADVSTTNPIGGSTATQLTSGGSNNSVLQVPSLVANVPHTVRFWVRGGTSTQMQFGYFSGSFQTASNITVVGSGSVTGTGLMTITGLSTTTWTQVTFVLASPAAGGFLPFYPDTATPTVGRTNFVWGVQINPGTTASAYNRTTTTAYHAPRFDHDPATLAPKGLLIEGSVTNLVTRSQAWNTSPWSGSNIASVSETGSGSPEGISTSQVLTFTNGTAAGSAFWQNANIPVSASTAYTWSVWVKTGNTKATFFCRNNGFAASRHIILDLTVTPPTATVDIGSSYGFTSVSTPTVQEYPNGWYRITTGGTTPAGTTNLWIGFQNRDAIPASGTNTVTGFGLQLEAGSGASSYIPTGSGTVQRAADLCQMTGTNFSSWFGSPTSATVYAEAFANIIPPASNFPGVWLMNKSGAARNYGFVRHTNGALRVAGFNAATGGSIVDIETTPNTTVTAGTRFKHAVAMTDLNWSYAANAGTGVNTGTNTTVYFDETVDSLTIGLAPTQLGSHTIAKLKYWPVALPTATLQSLTQ